MSVSMINGHIDEVMSDEEIIAKKLDSLHEKILKSKFAETVYESEVMALILAVQTINRQKAEIDILIRKHDTLRDEIAGKDMEIERLRAEAYKEFAEKLSVKCRWGGVKRNLDGIYFRVKRNEQYENVCFSDLTETEREEICKDRTAEWYKSVAYHLADRIKTIGDTFDIVAD